MNYFIQRGVQQYGPYSLADLQRYVQQGNIALTDLARSDGMADWVPVSQIIGNVSVPFAVPPYGAPYGIPSGPPAGAVPYGSPGPYSGGMQQMPIGSLYPPPSLHWGLVLLFAIFSCGIFRWIWIFVEAAWVKRVRPSSKVLILYGFGLAGYLLGGFAGGFLGALHSLQPDVIGAYRGVQVLFIIAGWIVKLIGHFTMRSDIEDYYNREEPIGLELSGVMTFFFGSLYFQYHFTRINEMKRMVSLQHSGAIMAR